MLGAGFVDSVAKEFSSQFRVLGLPTWCITVSVGSRDCAPHLAPCPGRDERAGLA
jgi:hypothetical protein